MIQWQRTQFSVCIQPAFTVASRSQPVLHSRSVRYNCSDLDFAGTLHCRPLCRYWGLTACRVRCTFWVARNTNLVDDAASFLISLTITHNPIWTILATRMRNAAKTEALTLAKTVNSVLPWNTNYHTMTKCFLVLQGLPAGIHTYLGAQKLWKTENFRSQSFVMLF